MCKNNANASFSCTPIELQCHCTRVHPTTPVCGEQQFFAAHPHFKGCDPKLFGVENLTSRLTRLLVTRIQAELSPMKAEVESALGAVRTELKGLSGYGAATGPADRQKLLVTVTQVKKKHTILQLAQRYQCAYSHTALSNEIVLY